MDYSQAPLSMGFPRQEHWSGCHALLQGIFPTQGSNLHLLHVLPGQVGSLPLELPAWDSVFPFSMVMCSFLLK